VPSPTPPPPDAARSKRLPRNVVALGWVSLLTDAASDMIYPLVPAFLAAVGGGAVAVGWVEGVAEATAAVLKLLSGRRSDRTGERKPLVVAGYSIATVARPFIAIATHPWHVVLVRAVDRVGKGMRGPPRDALLANAIEPSRRASAFGYHRMMDNLGGALGPVLAFVLLQGAGLSLRTVFALSIVPGLLSVLVVSFFVREAKRSREAPIGEAKPSAPEAPRIPRDARVYLATLALFALAGSGDLFLMRRLTDLGMSVALVPLAWLSLNLGKSLLNLPGGRAADRYGRRRVVSLAWLFYGVTYAGFAAAPTWGAAWIVLALYAAHYGLAEGGQKALLADYIRPEARGHAFGVQLAIEGAVALPANVSFGLAYDRLGAPLAFAIAGGVAVLAAGVLAFIVPSPRPSEAA
jgi:MFS family permease